MLNVVGKHLPIDSGMAPRLEANLFSQLAREALGPLPTRIVLGHVLDGVWMDVFLVRAHIIYDMISPRRFNNKIWGNSKINSPNCVANWISNPTA